MNGLYRTAIVITALIITLTIVAYLSGCESMSVTGSACYVDKNGNHICVHARPVRLQLMPK